MFLTVTALLLFYNFEVGLLLLFGLVCLVMIQQGAGTEEPGSSIAKDLIDSEDPKHTLFCRETAFVAIQALFKG